MKHVETIVLVKDIERTKDFYTTHFQLEILHDWKTMVIFTNRLAFHQADQLFPQHALKAHLRCGEMGCGNVIIYLETENIEETLASLKADQIGIIHEIIKVPWGNDRILRVTDPDGHLVEIGQVSR